MSNQNVRLISLGSGRKTAQIVIITSANGTRTSRTRHLVRLSDGNYGYHTRNAKGEQIVAERFSL